MTADPSRLLQQLGSGVRPVGPVAPASREVPFEGASFSELLARARSGGITSGQPVSLPDSLAGALSDADRAELSRLTDQAHASGVRRALVLRTDGALLLDVANRSITGTADASARVLGGIDGVIRLDLADRGGPGDRASGLRKLGSIGSASLGRVLDQTRDTG